MVTKADFLKQLFSDSSTYSSDIDYAAAETGYSLPETFEEQSARKNPEAARKIETGRKAPKTKRVVSAVPDYTAATAGAEPIDPNLI